MFVKLMTGLIIGAGILMLVALALTMPTGLINP